MAKSKKKRPKREEVFEPTPEQFAAGTFERAGLAYRRVPVIDTMLQVNALSRRQYDGLRRYRDVALADDRSPLRDSLGKLQDGIGGGGTGLPPSAIRIAIEVGRLERALGVLREIARAIAVDDTTVSQWAIKRAGSVMRTRTDRAKTITWFAPPRKAYDIAMQDVRMAGERLAAEIGA